MESEVLDDVSGNRGVLVPRAPVDSDRIGDFEIIREIGRGGMGIVYLAKQISLGRRVALKILPPEFTGDPERLQRFRREAAVISRLDHDCIAPVYGVGEENGVHFIAMKYLEGETLDVLIATRRAAGRMAQVSSSCRTEVLSSPASPIRAESRELPPTDEALVQEASDTGWVHRCLRIAEKVGLALHHAHGRGIIHRDVKPGNIFIDNEGEPWLLDFGLVRDLETGSLTESQGILGTAFYMAPETVTNDRENCDHRIDVYGLAATLYEMVTLRRPFDYNSPDTLFHCIVNEDPRPPKALVSELPVDVSTVILKGLEKAPEARFSSALEMAQDLRRIRRFEPILSRPTGWVQRIRRAIRRNPGGAAALLFSLLSFLGMVEYTLYERGRSRKQIERALATANEAYDAGRRREALDGYRIYLALGGDIEGVRGRMDAVSDLKSEK